RRPPLPRRRRPPRVDVPGLAAVTRQVAAGVGPAVGAQEVDDSDLGALTAATVRGAHLSPPAKKIANARRPSPANRPHVVASRSLIVVLTSATTEQTQSVAATIAAAMALTSPPPVGLRTPGTPGGCGRGGGGRHGAGRGTPGASPAPGHAPRTAPPPAPRAPGASALS